MKIFPYEKLVLATVHSPQEIRRRLEEGVGRPRGGGCAALRKPEKLFEGNITDKDFLFWRAIRHTNGFMPLISGTIEPGQLVVTLKWHPFIQFFFPFWFALLIAMGWAAAGPPRASSCFSGIPLGIVAVVYVM